MSALIAEVQVGDLAKAIKSALVFAGSEGLSQQYAYVRFDRVGDNLYLTSGDRYQVASVRIEAEPGDSEVFEGPIYVEVASLKAAMVWLKPGRTKPSVRILVGNLTELVRPDTKERLELVHCDDPSPLPPAFQEPLAPIDWDCIIDMENPSRFAVSPELITKLARAAQSPDDAILVESGNLPHSPITFRIGTYMLVTLAPKDGRNGNSTTVAPNDYGTRRSWHDALTAMKLVRGSNNAQQSLDAAHRTA